jgi:hypothetical protein
MAKHVQLGQETKVKALMDKGEKALEKYKHFLDKMKI